MSSLFSKSPKWLLWLLGVIVVLGLSAGGYFYVQAKKAASATTSEPTLQTATVRQGDLTISATGSGSVIPSVELSFGFETSGKLIELAVNVGDKVEAGQLLAVLDDESQQLALQQAKRTLLELTSPSAIATAMAAAASAQQDVYDAIASRYDLNAKVSDDTVKYYLTNFYLRKADYETALKRWKKLADYEMENPVKAHAYQALYAAKQNLESAEKEYKYYLNYAPDKVEVDATNAAVAQAEARLQEASWYLAALQGQEIPEDATGSNLGQLLQAKLDLETAQADLDATRLTAPIAGTVMSISGSVGENVGSQTFMTIANLSQPYLNIYMDESDWDKVVAGYPVEITFDALPDAIFNGTVLRVDPQLYTQGNTSVVHAIVKVDNSDERFTLPVGSSGTVDILAGQAKNALLVPVEALHEAAGEFTVFLMENGTPKLRVIQIGLKDDFYAVVLSGLNPGDVVTTGVVETKQ